MTVNFNKAPIKQAQKIDQYKQSSKVQNTQYKLPNFKMNVNTSIPTKPQYHPLGSTQIPGADLKVATNQLSSIKPSNLSTLSKTASIKDIGRKFVTELTAPLNMGLSTMNVASGETSVGGELIGQTSSFAARKAIDPLLNKIYTEGVTPKTLPRRFGKGALGLVAGIGGYIGGNYLGNKYAPIFRRKSPDIYTPTSSEIDAINRVYNKGYLAGTVKTASVDNNTSNINPNKFKQGLNKLRSLYTNKVAPKVKKAVPYATLVGALGAGNILYRDKQRQAKESFYNRIAL